MAKLKCWQGNLDGKFEGLVAATSQRTAVEIVNTSLYDFNQYWHLRPIPDWPDFKPFTLYKKRFDTKDSWEVEHG